MSLMHEPGSGGPEWSPETPPATRRSLGGTARIIGLAAFALAPWLTCGIGSPVAFGVMAVLYGPVNRRLAALLWSSTVFYIASLITAMATVDSPPGTAGDAVLGVAVAVSVMVAGTEALALALLIGMRGYSRPASARQGTDIG